MRFFLPSFKGRTGRKTYAWRVVALYLIGWLLDAPARIAFRSLDRSFPAGDLPDSWRAIVWPHGIALAATIFFAFAAIWLVLSVLATSVRRLHDIDLSGWFIVLWALLFLLLPEKAMPSAYASTIRDAIWFGILILVPGTRGAKAFGPDPGDKVAAMPAPERGET